jgi:DNA-binding response OmpR family regulator
MYQLLYIDDEQDNLDLYAEALEGTFSVTTLRDLNSLKETINSNAYDGILVDIHMPQMDGYDVIKIIKSHHTGKDTPIFVFSSDFSHATKLKGLKAGIKDYLYKMMHIDEIIARLKNGIQDHKPVAALIKVGNLRINQNTFQVYINDDEISLTLTEYKELLFLCQNPNSIVPLDDLKAFVWNGHVTSDNTIRVHTSNLRSKLKAWDHQIQTKKGKGMTICRE